MFELVAIRDAIQKHGEQRLQPGTPAPYAPRATKEAALRRLARPDRRTPVAHHPVRQGSLLAGG